MVARCTKKMLDLLGARKLTLSELPPSDEDWYLNLVWIERQKCLLLTLRVPETQFARRQAAVLYS